MPATTVVLGDTSFDMRMARSAGAHALGVAWGYHTPADLIKNGAISVLHNYVEAPAAVLKLIGET
jgi:phosphoglycolate phosphatase